MRIMTRLTIFLAVLVLDIYGVANAQDYIVFSGGISIEERKTAPTTGTKLEFFVSRGNFLSNVTVTVSNQAGAELVNTVTEGPWLILNLPNGRYNVKASISSGETQSLMLDVDGSNQKFGFMFRSVE